MNIEIISKTTRAARQRARLAAYARLIGKAAKKRTKQESES